jgi:hypothetical protein
MVFSAMWWIKTSSAFPSKGRAEKLEPVEEPLRKSDEPQSTTRRRYLPMASDGVSNIGNKCHTKAEDSQVPPGKDPAGGLRGKGR